MIAHRKNIWLKEKKEKKRKKADGKKNEKWKKNIVNETRFTEK